MSAPDFALCARVRMRTKIARITLDKINIPSETDKIVMVFLDLFGFESSEFCVGVWVGVVTSGFCVGSDVGAGIGVGGSGSSGHG